MSRAHRVLLACVVAIVGALALCVRWVHDQRIAVAPYEPSKGWFTVDPDSQYHMRRVERALVEGLPPAETDPWMNFPHGAAIPWPPYYTWVGFAAVAPFAPREPAALRRFVEQRVASLPFVFGALTSMLAAAIAWRALRGRPVAARAFGAALAGALHALMGASLIYSSLGNGDHHAWVTLLTTALFGGALHALGDAELSQPRRSAWRGAALGLVAGVLLGSWVGGLVQLALLQLALGLALFAHARSPRPGLPAFGLGLHLAWAASIAPAVLTSPWRSEQPWMLVNLSWAHLALPLLGALVFAPLVARPDAAVLRRRWPIAVGATLVLAAALLAVGNFALARGVREGFAWAGRSNEFMAFIAESQPLGWGATGGVRPTLEFLGYGALALPLAFGWLAWRAWKEHRLDLALLALVLPPLTIQALVQQRFADALGPPLSIALGVALGSWGARPWRSTAWKAAAAGVGLGIALQAPTMLRLPARIAHPWHVNEAHGELRARRELYEWIAAHSDPRQIDAVLASWDHGHALEWVARRASIGTNFGSYVGADSYLDPWRFFLEDDPRAAEALLEARRARYVLIGWDFSKDLEVMLRLLRPLERRSYLWIPERGPVWVSPRFFSTLAARLMLNGRVGDMERRTLVGPSLDFLRLVHVSPRAITEPVPVRHANGPLPTGWIWERVRGARLVAQGAPGQALRVELDLEYPSEVQGRLTWVGEAAADERGVAELRIPYCTDAPNGDGVARGAARWSFGERSGTLSVPAAALADGRTLRL